MNVIDRQKRLSICYIQNVRLNYTIDLLFPDRAVVGEGEETTKSEETKRNKYTD